MRTFFVRSLSYKVVPRPETFKVVSRPEYEPKSLAIHLSDRIRAGGPISVADYMRTVLSHPRKGYYTQGDVFGERGDFTTSPEISPLFGEMIAVWFCHELRKIGSPRPLQLVELGPGRGTLASDLIKVFSNLSPGAQGISIHLVEISERLAHLQAQKLGVSDLEAKLSETSPHYQHGTTPDDLHIYWYKSLTKVPKGFSIFLAHEFFDALPIHKFQKTNGEWKEVVVNLKNEESSEPKFELVLSNKANSPISMLISPKDPRQHVEVNAEAADLISQMSQRLEEEGGISLIIDYGHTGEKGDTFRAFKQHKLHEPLEEPGSADLTADVDFEMLRRVAGDRVCSFGPVPQGEFLCRMGINTRLENLLPQVPPDQVDSLKSGVKMITEDMGQRFKVMALFPAVLKDHLARFPVAGFHQN